MKIRYTIIGIVVTLIIGALLRSIIGANAYEETIQPIIAIFFLSFLGLTVYLFIRNIFRAIEGAITGTPQGGNYQSEARKAVEEVTPKRKQDVKPPWEE